MRSVRSSILCKAMVGAVVASWVAGCATDRLDAAPPGAVNLSGDWKLNLNLSDDPDHLGPDLDTSPKHAPEGHHGRGGGMGGPGGIGGPGMGGPGGMGAPGSPNDNDNYQLGPTANYSTANTGFVRTANVLAPARGASIPALSDGANPGGFVRTALVTTAADGAMANAASDSPASGSSVRTVGTAASASDFLPVALSAPGIEESATLPSTTASDTGKSTGKPSRGASINRILRAPLTMSITQDRSTVTVKANMPDGVQATDQYVAGTTTTIPFGKDETAERTAGWRGPVFVVTTAAKKFGKREDDFAIDDDGRLIMTTQTKGGRLGKVEIKRVYDRVKSARP